VARARRVKPDEQLTLVEHLDELRSRIKRKKTQLEGITRMKKKVNNRE